MIDRYTRPEMGRLWTDEARYRRWLDVELAVCDVLAERGTIPREAAAHFRAQAARPELVDPARIAEIEIDHESKLRTATTFEEVEKFKSELAREKERLNAEMEEKVEAVRKGS